MENEEVNNESLFKQLYSVLVKISPYLISIFVIILIGLSFIGNMFVVSHEVDGQLISNNVSLATLLFEHTAGVSAEIYFIFIYLLLPLIACVLLVFSPKHLYFKTASMIIFLTISVASIVSKDLYLEAIYYYYKTIEGVKYSFELSDFSLSYVMPIVCYFVSFIICFVSSFKDIHFSIKDITEMGVFIALAYGLNFIKIMPMPTGGSVNLQMLPLFFLALRRGPLKGFIAGGIVYGLITCLTDGYGFATYPLDYLLGFGSIAAFGFFSPYILVVGEKRYTLKGELLLLAAGVIATTIRFIAGTVSSMVVYGYDIIPAMAYNSLYIFVSGALSLAILMALLGPLCRINTRFPVLEERGL